MLGTMLLIEGQSNNKCMCSWKTEGRKYCVEYKLPWKHKWASV